MKSPWILLLGLCMYGVHCEQPNLGDILSGQDLVRAVYEDSERIRLEGLRPRPRLPMTKKDVCFDEIGCFSKEDGPFSFTSTMPESPEQIQSSFALFTPSSPDKAKMLTYKDKTTLETSLLNPERPLAVISHGLNENGGKTWIQNLKFALLNQGFGGVIVVDWGKGAVLPFYGQAMVNSEVVGREVAYILEILHKTRGFRMEEVHLLGYSLGAHLSGFIGKTIYAKTGHKIGRITGLDPAGPTFEDKTAKTHLGSDDALYVDVVHTSAGTSSILMGDLGIIKPIGHVDYYPNGGKEQPGCGIFDLTCSHRRGNELFLESITSSCRFTSFPCPGGYKDYKAGKCNQCVDPGCGHLGFHSHISPGKGSLYLHTNKSAPYCLKS